MTNKNKLLLFLFSLSALFPLSAMAGIIPCGNGSEVANACTLCYFIIGIKNVISFGAEILITVAVVGIFIAGVMYIISSGNEEAMTRAKGFLGASIKGFAIVSMAWLFVNVTLWVLSAKSDLGIGKTNWYTFTCVTQSSAGNAPVLTPKAGEYGEDISDKDYTYDAGIASQTKDASPALINLLNCMKTKLPNSAKRISSISDSTGMSSCSINTWKRPPCAHTKYSCHYGGKTCQGKSYAVDFGNEQFSSQITSAASACGGTSINEGNHIHVSTGNCGCDGH